MGEMGWDRTGEMRCDGMREMRWERWDGRDEMK